MSRLSRGRVRSAAARVVIALAVIGGGAGAVAYAATLPASGPRVARSQASAQVSRPLVPTLRKGRAGRIARPRLTGFPEKVAASSAARFAFTVSGAGRGFLCRVDGGRWKRCRSPLRLSGLGAVEHSFSVRASLGRRRGPAISYRWTVVEPKPIAVEPLLSGLAPLFPGEPQAVPVVLRNPNSVPVTVTAVRVAATADPPGCDSASNFELTPASLSGLAPLTIPAGGAVGLPAPGFAAPTIALRDLPVNQDACQGAQLPLLFSAEAHG